MTKQSLVIANYLLVMTKDIFSNKINYIYKRS